MVTFLDRRPGLLLGAFAVGALVIALMWPSLWAAESKPSVDTALVAGLYHGLWVLHGATALAAGLGILLLRGVAPRATVLGLALLGPSEAVLFAVGLATWWGATIAGDMALFHNHRHGLTVPGTILFLGTGLQTVLLVVVSVLSWRERRAHAQTR